MRFTVETVRAFFWLVVLAFLLCLPQSRAAVGDTFTDDNFKYTVLSEEGATGTVSVAKRPNTTLSGAVTIPASVASGEIHYSVALIPNHAFSHCSSLISISIPESVTSMGARVFLGCTSLVNIEVAPDNPHYSSLGGVLFNKDETVVVSPDIGGVKRASKFAAKLGVPLAILDKRRPKDNVAEMVHIIGEVEGKTAIIFDDIIDTGRSLVEASKMLKSNGAQRIFACATHGVLSGEAKEIIAGSELEKVFITDTIHHDDLPENIRMLSIAPLLAEALTRVRKNLSVSILFR